MRARRIFLSIRHAAIAGNKKTVNELVTEHRLSRRELEARLEIRDGERYDLAKKGGRAKASGKKKSRRQAAAGRTTVTVTPKAGNVLDLIDGRTTAVTLLKIAYRANELLDAKPKAEVQKIEKAMENAEKLREQYEEAMALIGEEPPI